MKVKQNNNMNTQKFGITRNACNRKVADDFPPPPDITCISSKALLALSTSTQNQGLTAILTVVNQ